MLSSPPMLQGDTTPQILQSAVHSNTYQAAVTDLVHSICSDPTELEINETLLATYFAWQAPQHMPVDERMFRRTCGQAEHTG